MTNDIDLLPLPWSDVQPNGRRWLFNPEDRPRVEDYARACVAHAIAAKDAERLAEVERLREIAEKRRVLLGEVTGAGMADRARAERLAEAGRRVTAAFRALGETTPFTREADRTRHECESAMLALDAALEQEAK